MGAWWRSWSFTKVEEDPKKAVTTLLTFYKKIERNPKEQVSSAITELVKPLDTKSEPLTYVFIDDSNFFIEASFVIGEIEGCLWRQKRARFF